MAVIVKINLALFFLLTAFFTQAQSDVDRYNYYFVGFKVRSPRYLDYTHKSVYSDFLELTFGKIENAHFSYYLKMGLDSYTGGKQGNVDIGFSKTGEIADSYRASGCFIKPCWVFVKKIGPVYSSFLSANFNITLTRHQLEINITDPVYGNETDSYTHYKFYPFSGVELEHSNMVNIAGRVDLNVSYYVGYRIVNPALFNEVMDGYGDQANFVPGASGLGGRFYFNVLCGFNVHLY